ncbi:uncharacterized protein LOC120552119 isoform X2 [Perca fluviatilis]|uniref:uncharacterized protein LOC120552119 isoform X2 n=1 Tax=Perca fluviatilis TaxID=8168 RepID=UPI0019651DC8|nr:uncharacterized protein LOC120552119 isoform X2 [Perca fluviatilis]
MRGITLLGLVGFILTASWPKGSMVPLTMDTRPLISVWNPLDNDSGFPQLPAGIHPMENENGTNTTTNSSMVLQDRRNYIIQLNGTREVVDNTDGFQPPPDGEDTQWPKGSMVPLTKDTRPLISVWNPLDNDSGFPQLPAGIHPMENENGTNTTTNSSMVLQDRRNYIIQLNGTREVVDNTDGFQPPPDGEDTQGKN